MSNITLFYRLEDERTKYIFLNKPVRLHRDGNTVQFPCIGLYRRDLVIPVAHPRFERWYLQLNKSEELASVTLRKRSIAVCAFLNFILWETSRSCLHEITLGDIRQFLRCYRNKENGQQRSSQGWHEGISFVYEFLCNYYLHNKDVFDFSYRYEDLISTQVVRNSSTRRKMVVKDYNFLSVKAPRQMTTKNRMLLYGYLDFILMECEMYDPELTLGVALQAYAGLREGEVVNLSYNRISLRYAGFGRIGDISIDLTTPASFAMGDRKADFGNIKVLRKQMVYPDFNDGMLRIYEAHTARHGAMGYPVSGEAPVFLNEWGKPMSVHTYTRRIKELFYGHFLPDLKKASEKMGCWATDAPYIEAYEEDYPGAHAFRHWFTMYLFQRAKLTTDEISKWRGDSSRESMLTYIHINADMLEAYRSTAHTFQRSWLEDIL